MKKILFFISFLLMGFVGQAQGDLRLGINAGLPVGDADSFTSFNLGADVSYLFGVGDSFSAGPMVGVSHFFGKEENGFEVDDITFLPIAATGRIGFNGGFFLGADLGYALGINEGNDGGFYYKPKIGYSFGMMNVNLAYSGISSDGFTTSAITAGVEFDL